MLIIKKAIKFILPVFFGLLFFSQTFVAIADERVVTLNHNCETLDTLLAYDSLCYGLLTDVHEGLVRIGPDGEPQPGVAEKWEWNGTEKKLTFHLKGDRKWSDGAPVVAEDFALSWRRILRDKNAQNPFKRFLKLLMGATDCETTIDPNCPHGLKVIDDRTLVLEFDRIDRLFPLRTLNGGLLPLPSHFYRQHEEGWVFHKDRPFNGAYRILNYADIGPETIKTTALKLIPNDEHPETGPDNVPLAIYRFGVEMPKGAKIREMVRDGDAADIQQGAFGINLEARQILDRFGWSVIPQHNVSLVTMLLNVDTVEPELLQAMKLLIDTDELVSRMQRKFAGTPATRLFNHGSAAQINVKLHLIDKETKVEDARALLARIGIGPTNRRQLTIAYWKDERTIAPTHLSAMLAIEGIDLKIVEGTNELVRDPATRKNVDGVYMRWYVSLPDPSGFLVMADWAPFSVFKPQQLNKFNELQNSSGKFQSDAERRAGLFKAEQMFVNEGGILPLIHPEESVIYRNNLCGVVGSQSMTSPLLWVRHCEPLPD